MLAAIKAFTSCGDVASLNNRIAPAMVGSVVCPARESRGCVGATIG